MIASSICNARPPALPASVLPLVLLPGTLCDERLFEPLLARLDLGDRAVVHVDFAGARSVDAAVARVLAAMPARAILLGFSLGGIVALALARSAPGRVAALALVDTTARPMAPAAHAERRTVVAHARADMAGYARDVLVPGYLADPSDASVAALLVTMATAADAGCFADQTELALSRDDARAWLPRLDMPVLVAGGVLDRVNPPAVQVELAGAMPDATLALIDGAGHFTPLEQPAGLAAHVATWLARADEREFSTIMETQR